MAIRFELAHQIRDAGGRGANGLSEIPVARLQRRAVQRVGQAAQLLKETANCWKIRIVRV